MSTGFTRCHPASTSTSGGRGRARRLWPIGSAEAAAAGSPPIVARHSGLAEIALGLEAQYPEHLRDLTSFASGDAHDLSVKLRRLLALPPDDVGALREGARRAAVERWSWAGVA